jgi:hypothetical protein
MVETRKRPAQHAASPKGDPPGCFGYLLPVSTSDLENDASTEITARQTR